MADGRHLGKIVKSLYLGRGWIDFDQIWHIRALAPSGTINHTNTDIQAMSVWLIVPFYDFCGPRFFIRRR